MKLSKICLHVLIAVASAAAMSSNADAAFTNEVIECTVKEVYFSAEDGSHEDALHCFEDSEDPLRTDGKIYELEGVTPDFKKKYYNQKESIEEKVIAKFSRIAKRNKIAKRSKIAQHIQNALVREEIRTSNVRLKVSNFRLSNDKIELTNESTWSLTHVVGNIKNVESFDSDAAKAYLVENAPDTGESKVLVIHVTANDSVPTRTPARMSDWVFGTDGHSPSGASQYAAISFGKKTLIPGEGPEVVDGVLAVTIDHDVQGVDGGAGAWRNKVEAAANAKLGFSLQSQYNLVMIVCPPGMTGGWAGYAYPNGWMSVYKYNYIDNINVIMHELGHNFNLAHSGKAGETFAYGDNTGYMGSASTTYSAFNGAKSSQLGWYSDREYVIDSDVTSDDIPDSWTGNLLGVVDYAKASGDEQVLLWVKGATGEDIHIAFNRKKGFNSNSMESANQITVTKRGSRPGYSQSRLLAKLDKDSVYVVDDFGGSGNDLYIKVDDIVLDSNVDDSTVDYAEVSAHFTGGYPGNVQFPTQTFYANESQGTVSIAVQRSAGSLGAASVDYALSTGSSATLGSDFNFSAGTLYWEDGEDGLKTINISILQDGNIEDDETINLVLQNVTGASLNSLVEATVTLEDDDLNEVEVSISTGNDDVEERQDGTVDMSSSDLEMVFDGQDQIIGLRFNNINVPQSSNILNAYIQFTVDESTSNETNLIIHGENIGDAQPFDSQNVSSRSTTSNTVNWSVPTWSPNGSSGEDERTPDLSSIVTEIVNLQDWILGNSMVFKITGSGKRVAEAYEGSRTSSAKLYIEYSNTYVVVDTDGDGIPDAEDAYPLISLGGLTDTDGDGAPDECDEVCLATGMEADVFPNDPTEWADSDGDGFGDNSDPGELNLALTSYSVAENASSLTVTVVRSAGTSDEISIDYSLQDGTATATLDYQSLAGTLIFLDGETSKSIAITILDDVAYEGDEDFTITLSNPTGGGSLGAINSAVINIIEDDAVPPASTLSLSASSYSANENDSSVSITVNRISGSNGEVSVDYSTSDGTATASSDYTSSAGTLTFLDGETSKSFDIALLDDTTYEGDESYNINLSNFIGIGAGANVQAVITIIEDDAVPAAGILSLSASSYSANENDLNVSITVNRISGSDGEVSVDYSTSDGTATASSDYTSSAGTLTFLDGETSKSIDIALFDDTTYEGDESYNISLSNFIGAVAGANVQAVITIVEDDPVPPYGEIALSSATYSVNENAGSLLIDINRSNGTYGEVSVTWQTQNTTAVAGEDYVAGNGTLTFADGETNKQISLTITDDTNYEGAETFAIRLANPQGGVSLGSIVNSVVTINEDDSVPPAGSFQWSSEAYSVDENAGNALLTINRINGSYGDVTVDVNSTDISATFYEDYFGEATTISFTDGETSKAVYIEIVNDFDFEGNETFSVSLSNPTGNSEVVNPVTTRVTIVEDDPVPTAGSFRFSGDSYSVNENAGTIDITINRINGSYGDVSVQVQSVDDTAVGDVDYESLYQTLTFLDGEASKIISVTVIDDVEYEGNESLMLELINPTGDSVVINPSIATLTIVEDEAVPPSGVFNWAQTSLTVSESVGSFNMTLNRDSGSYGECRVTASVSHDSTNSSDLTGTTAVELVFADNETSKTTSFTIQDDSIDENNETFTINLSSPQNCSIGNNDAMTITITDNDSVPPADDQESSGGGGSFNLPLILWMLFLSGRVLIRRKQLH